MAGNGDRASGIQAEDGVATTLELFVADSIFPGLPSDVPEDSLTLSHDFSLRGIDF